MDHHPFSQWARRTHKSETPEGCSKVRNDFMDSYIIVDVRTKSKKSLYRLSWKIVGWQHCFVNFGCGTDNIFLQNWKISNNHFLQLRVHTWVGFITISLKLSRKTIITILSHKNTNNLFFSHNCPDNILSSLGKFFSLRI